MSNDHNTNTELLYCIHWRSLITGATGHGTGSFSLPQAEDIVRYLNISDRAVAIEHWHELAEQEPESVKEEQYEHQDHDECMERQ